MFENFIIVFLISLSLTGLIIPFLNKKRLFLDRKEESKPQKVHKKSVPRGGWISILTSFGIGLFLTKSLIGIKFIAAYLPLLVSGIIEDHKRTSYKIRFIFMFFSALLAILFLKSIVWTIGFGNLPIIVAVVFSIIALIGAVNAFNIVDGLNGLASGLGILSGITYYAISEQLGLNEYASLNAIFVAALLGFFVWNFPFGKIFLGDTGSYFVGFFVGVMSILIAGGYHEGISPWVAMLIMFYPVWETLFSFWRRLRKGKNPFEPDKEHFHHLLFYFFKKSHFKTVSVILIFQGLVDFSVILLKEETLLLILEFFTLATLYIFAYKTLSEKVNLQ